MSELTFVRLPRGEVCTQGAHATRWQARDGREVLFVSSQSRFTAGTAIRGGVPVVFPWFGDDPEGRGRPAHGFARRVPWTLVAARSDLAQGRAVFTLADDAATRALWPHAFAVELAVACGDELVYTVAIENRDAAPLRCEFALHSYFAVGDVRAVEVHGLGGARYYDKVDGGRPKTQREEVLRLTGETDRTYVRTTGSCALRDPGFARTVHIATENAPSTVVWNPWIEKTKRLLDLGDDEWPRFVCIESGCVQDDAVTLPPGGVHRLAVRIGCTG